MDVLAEGSDKHQMLFTNNVDDKILLSRDHVLRVSHKVGTQEPQPVLNLDNHLTAKLNRAVFYRLVDCAVERGNGLAVLSDGCWFELGGLDA